MPTSRCATARGDLTLQVRDDGRGATASDGLGHGLVGIRERVKIYGGEMSAGAAGDRGFVLRARLPSGRCPMSIRVLVVDDQAMVRAGFTCCSTTNPTSTSWPRRATGSRRSPRPHDSDPTSSSWTSGCRELDGLEATRRILAADAGARVLILTTFNLDDYVYEALAAGASGFVLKDDPPEHKLEQVLPNRLRRRVNAVHTNVSSMRWGGNQTTVDADAFGGARDGVPRQRAGALRLHATRRRQRVPTRRTAHPRVRGPALVSRGLGRAPRRLAHVPARPVDRAATRRRALQAARELPAPDAAAYVRQSIAAMPVPFEATLVVAGALDDVRSLIRYADARTDPIDDTTCRVVLRSDTRAWLATVITLLASEYDVTIEEPADLLPEVRRFGTRLRRVAST